MRFVLAGLVLASAGCAAASARPTWAEPVTDGIRMGAHGDRVFHFNRDWQVGNCSIRGGSHVTLKHGGRVVTMLALSNPHRDSRLRYGITFLAADGSPLGHLPYPGGGLYVADLEARYPNVMRAWTGNLPPEVFEQVARVLLHASC
jgi:hypothetical protein